MRPGAALPQCAGVPPGNGTIIGAVPRWASEVGTPANRPSGAASRAADHYRDLDLAFLERYFDYAAEYLLPPDLASHVRREFAAPGIDPVTIDDDLELTRRTDGWPLVPLTCKPLGTHDACWRQAFGRIYPAGNA